MTPYECYIDYLALKRHFTTKSYDYFKYQGKVRSNQDSFDKRRDKFFFEKLARKPDPHGLMLANIVQNPKIWIKDILSEALEKNYKAWQKRRQSLTYIIKSEINSLHEDFGDNFRVKDGNIPHAINLFFSDKISIETLAVMCDVLKILPVLDQKMKDNLVFLEIKTLLEKYTPFIEYDKERVEEVILSYFDNV